RRRHTRFSRDWSSDVCSSDLVSEAARIVSQSDLLPMITATSGVFAVNPSPFLCIPGSLAMITPSIADGTATGYTNAGTEANTTKIGRASCRERRNMKQQRDDV